MNLVRTAFVGLLAMCGSVACYTAPEHAERDEQNESGQALGAEGAGDLPRDVAEVFARCTSCHSATHTAAPMALVRYEDLVAPGHGNKRTIADEAVARMRSTSAPMPPSGPRVPESEIGRVEKWLANGTPRCGSDER
jgi:hypothetical protein